MAQVYAGKAGMYRSAETSRNSQRDVLLGDEYIRCERTHRGTERVRRDLPERCADGERDGVALRRWKPLCPVISQVDKDPRSTGVLGMVRLPWHQVKVQVGEPLSLGELHEIRLHAAGDSLQCGSQAAYEPTELIGCLRRQFP